VELTIAALVGLIGLSYLCELIIAPPDWHAALFHAVVPQLPDDPPSRSRSAIIGATIIAAHALRAFSIDAEQDAPAQ